MRVLVVDDDASVRLILRRVLTGPLKCTVTEAADGVEALQEAARHPYELVLLDLVMPNLDGLETLAALRGDQRLASVPVVVLSADREEASVRRALELGVSDYLSKPLNVPVVTDRLRRITGPH